MTEAVHTRVLDSVLVVTLDRPSANAIDVATSLALYDAFARLEREAELRVLDRGSRSPDQPRTTAPSPRATASSARDGTSRRPLPERRSTPTTARAGSPA